MSDITMPIEVSYGKVVGRFLLSGPDSTDPDRLPEAHPAVGTVSFKPVGRSFVSSTSEQTLVVRDTVVSTLDGDGNLLDPEGSVGVWLGAGQYKVSYNLEGVRLRNHIITVLPTHDDAVPLDLTNVVPPGGPVLTRSEFSELADRMSAFVSKTDPRLEDQRAPLPHTHDDRYYTEAEIDSRLLAKATVDSVLFEVDLRTQGDDDILEQLGNEITLRSQGDAALDGRIVDLENAVPDLSGYATDADLVSGLASKANTSHTHTSASISDFREAVEDAMAATLVGSGITVSHEDGSDTITLTGVAGSDAEAVRDAIGAALIGVGPISIVPNDSGDTIVITVSATVNSTDAALRERSTHTGVQPMSSVTGLEAALAAQAVAPPNTHKDSHKKDTGSDPLTPADIGAATAAQGAKADTAVQPADLTVYATDAELAAAIATRATAAQGAKADSAVQPADLTVYATDAELAAAIATRATAAQGAKADSAVQSTVVDAKGDLLVGSANDTLVRFPVGSDGKLLYADSAQPNGIRWGDAPIAGGGGVGTLLIDYGGTVPPATPSGTIVFEKAGVPVVFDFTQGALPSGWAAHNGATATFSGSGINVNTPVTGGFHKDMAVAAECYLEFWLVSQASWSNIMFGPHFTDAVGGGSQVNWYSAPNALLTTGLSTYNYNAVYSWGGPVPAAPARFRLHKKQQEYQGHVSLDNGVSWTIISPVITNPSVITRIGFGASISTAQAVISKLIYTPGPPPGNGGKAKGWWDGSTLQYLA